MSDRFKRWRFRVRFALGFWLGLRKYAWSEARYYEGYIFGTPDPDKLPHPKGIMG